MKAARTLTTDAAQASATLRRTRVRPRPVFCIIADVYRDRAVAEAVCRGSFTHAGLTLELGAEPDWLASVFPEDAEWRIEWSKFYYGLDLAHAYRETGDACFPAAWERLVRSWIRQVPVGFDTSDVSARRIQNWIYAWDSFVNASGFDGFAEDFEEELTASLAAQVTRLRGSLTAERNHRTLELYALFIAALALPRLDAGGSLLDFAVAELHRNLLTDVRPDGVHREHSTHYHMLVLRSYLGARENAQRFRVPFPEGFDEHLQRAFDFALHCRRPDGVTPALSDSDTCDYSGLLALAAGLFERPDYLYAATGGAQGKRPERSNVSFPDGGYFVQRSGWGTDTRALRDERFLIFDAGALGDGGHGHYDALSFEAYARGRALVVDPGRYTYSEHADARGENLRRWFKGTAAHNTVCVDGLDQTPYRCGKPKGPAAHSRLIERVSAPSFDVLCGEVLSPAYEARHVRRVFFVAGEYWLVVDDLSGERRRRYDLRFHLSEEAWRRARVESNGVNGVVRAPGLALVFGAPHAPRLEDGWVSHTYGVKHPAPVVSVVAEGEASARFFTLVFPLDADDRAPALFVGEGDGSRARRVRVDGVGEGGAATDVITWDAREFSWTREGAEGAP
jgi:hypothetical protein